MSEPQSPFRRRKQSAQRSRGCASKCAGERNSRDDPWLVPRSSRGRQRKDRRSCATLQAFAAMARGQRRDHLGAVRRLAVIGQLLDREVLGGGGLGGGSLARDSVGDADDRKHRRQPGSEASAGAGSGYHGLLLVRTVGGEPTL